MNQMRIAVSGVGKGLPERIVTNEELGPEVGVEAGWIERRTGIRERRFVTEADSSSTLAIAAAEASFDSGASREVDAVIVGTSTPDYPFPPTATIVQNALDLPSSIAFDIGGACAGFLHSFITGAALVSSGAAHRALVIGVDILSRHLNRDDPATASVFGDGAAAMVIEADPRVAPLAFKVGCDGSHAEDVYIPAGGSRTPVTSEVLEQKLNTIHMSGGQVYRHAVTFMTKLAQDLDANTADLVVAHQANKRILAEVAARLGIEDSRFFVNVDRYGNTSAASVPIAVAEAWEAGRLTPGDQLLMIGLGAGYTWAGVRLEWTLAPHSGKPMERSLTLAEATV